MVLYIGNQNVEGSSDTASDGYVYSNRFQCGADMTLGKLYFYGLVNSGDYYRLGIYSDDAGAPDALLGEIVGPIKGRSISEWLSELLPWPGVALTNGTWYWLSLYPDHGWNDSPFSYYWYSNTAPEDHHQRSYGNTYPTFPDPYGSTLKSERLLSIYGSDEGPTDPPAYPLPGFLHS